MCATVMSTASDYDDADRDRCSVPDDEQDTGTTSTGKETDRELMEEPRPDTPDTDATEYPKGATLLFIVAALFLSVFLICLDMTIVATAVPRITDEFGGLDHVSWYGSAFFLTLGGFQSAWGKVYKYFNLKVMFILSIMIFELGSLLCGVAPSSIALIIGRAIAGLGAAGIATGAYTINAFATEPKRRALFTGLIGLSYGIACVLGPLIGGAFTTDISWRWCFYINLPIGGLSLFLISMFFRAPTAANPCEATWKETILQMDPVGLTLILGAIASFLLALEYGGQTMPWNSSVVIGLFVGFAAMIITLCVWEHFQGERAMIPPRLIKKRMVLVSASYLFLFNGAYFVILYYLPIYFQSVDGVSAARSGINNLALIIAVTISMIAASFFVTATGLALPVEVTGAVISTVGAGLLYTLGLDSGSAQWVGYQILGGVGWGMAQELPIIVGQSYVDSEDISSVTAIIQFFQNLGSVFLLSASQAAFVNELLRTARTTSPTADAALLISTGATDLRRVFSAEQIPGILEAYVAGFKVTVAIAVAASGLSLLICLFGKWSRLPTASSEQSAEKGESSAQ